MKKKPKQTTSVVMQLVVNEITPSPKNPRRIAENDPTIVELSQSIKSNGLIHPVVVRKTKKGYELLAGLRRFTAVKLLKLPTITATVVAVDDKTAIEIIVLENLQRQSLNPIEESRGVEMLCKAGKSVEEIADRLGKSPAWVYRRASLTKLIPAISEDVERGTPNQKRPDLGWYKATAQMLECVARLPAKTQESVYGRFSTYCSADNLAVMAKNALMELSRAPFMESEECNKKCTACQKRTDVQTTLFDDMKEDGACCLDEKCYGRQVKAHIAKRIAELGGDEKTDVIEAIGGIADGIDGVNVIDDDELDYCEHDDEGARKVIYIESDGSVEERWVRENDPEVNERERAAQKRKRLPSRVFVVMAATVIIEELPKCHQPFVFALCVKYGIWADPKAVFCDVVKKATEEGEAVLFDGLQKTLRSSIGADRAKSPWGAPSECELTEARELLAGIGIDADAIMKKAEETATDDKAVEALGIKI